MQNDKRDLSKIIHISNKVHSKLKRFVTDKQIKGERTSLAGEAERAIIAHISKHE